MYFNFHCKSQISPQQRLSDPTRPYAFFCFPFILFLTGAQAHSLRELHVQSQLSLKDSSPSWGVNLRDFVLPLKFLWAFGFFAVSQASRLHCPHISISQCLPFWNKKSFHSRSIFYCLNPKKVIFYESLLLHCNRVVQGYHFTAIQRSVEAPEPQLRKIV